MKLRSLVSDVLDDGDELWVRDGDSVVYQGRYEAHSLLTGSNGVRLEFQNGDSYRVSDYNNDADDFGFVGDEEGVRQVMDE